MSHPRSVHEIYDNISGRKEGLRKALTIGMSPQSLLRCVQPCTDAPTDVCVLEMLRSSIEIATQRKRICVFTVRHCFRWADSIIACPRWLGQVVCKILARLCEVQGSPVVHGLLTYLRKKCQRNYRNHALESTLRVMVWQRKSGLRSLLFTQTRGSCLLHSITGQNSMRTNGAPLQLMVKMNAANYISRPHVLSLFQQQGS